MNIQEINNIVNETIYNEVKKTILEESNHNKEVYHITCDGEPIATFDTEEDAQEQLPKYKESHPDKELIIEKGDYKSYDDMIDELDNMGEKLEQKEGKTTKTKKDCHECGESSDDMRMEDKKVACDECGGEMKEGECVECGDKKLKESNKKKKVLRLTESEMIELIKKIVNENIPGLDVTKRAQKQSKTQNLDYAADLTKKMKKAASFDGNDNPEFPKPIGKGEKAAVHNTEEEEEEVEDTRGGTALNLDYDQEPSKQFKDRQKKSLEGDPTTGNSGDAANAIKTDLGKKLAKQAERKKKKEEEYPHYVKDPQPVKIVKEEKDKTKKVIEEEIKRMKTISGYNEKTQ